MFAEYPGGPIGQRYRCKRFAAERFCTSLCSRHRIADVNFAEIGSGAEDFEADLRTWRPFGRSFPVAARRTSTATITLPETGEASTNGPITTRCGRRAAPTRRRERERGEIFYAMRRQKQAVREEEYQVPGELVTMPRCQGPAGLHTMRHQTTPSAHRSICTTTHRFGSLHSGRQPWMPGARN